MSQVFVRAKGKWSSRKHKDSRRELSCLWIRPSSLCQRVCLCVREGGWQALSQNRVERLRDRDRKWEQTWGTMYGHSHILLCWRDPKEGMLTTQHLVSSYHHILPSSAHLSFNQKPDWGCTVGCTPCVCLVNIFSSLLCLKMKSFLSVFRLTLLYQKGKKRRKQTITLMKRYSLVLQRSFIFSWFSGALYEIKFIISAAHSEEVQSQRAAAPLSGANKNVLTQTDKQSPFTAPKWLHTLPCMS